MDVWQLVSRHRAGVGTKEKGAWKRGKQVSEKNFTNLSPIIAHALGTLGGLEGPCARRMFRVPACQAHHLNDYETE